MPSITQFALERSRFTVLLMLGLLLLALLNLIFAIVAAIKANENELWVYPLSIRFLKY